MRQTSTLTVDTEQENDHFILSLILITILEGLTIAAGIIFFPGRICADFITFLIIIGVTIFLWTIIGTLIAHWIIQKRIRWLRTDAVQELASRKWDELSRVPLGTRKVAGDVTLRHTSFQHSSDEAPHTAWYEHCYTIRRGWRLLLRVRSTWDGRFAISYVSKRWYRKNQEGSE